MRVGLSILCIAATIGFADEPEQKPQGGADMLITVDSTRTLAEVQEALPRACAAHKFGVLGVHDLKEKMKEKGVDYAGECLIFEVCNPQKAKQALEANPEISTALPCRISVYRTPEGKTRLATLRPTLLLDMFGTPGLQVLAIEVEETLKAIMAEAAKKP